MAVTQEDLENFHRFASQRIGNGAPELSLGELVEEWRAAQENRDVHAAIQESLADVEAGRTTPFREASAEFRRQNKLSPRDA